MHDRQNLSSQIENANDVDGASGKGINPGNGKISFTVCAAIAEIFK
jgi:hypothetical protein